MGKNKDPKHYQVFAVVRIDDFGDLKVIPETAIMITKIVWSEEEAKAEVNRLNQLNKDKGCVYLYKITRLVKL